MNRCKAVIRDTRIVALQYWCPGCGIGHKVNLDADKGHPLWYWNGNLEKPTLSPSVNYPARPRCHSFLREGRIEFLDDCDHAFAGKTVDAPDWEKGIDRNG